VTFLPFFVTVMEKLLYTLGTATVGILTPLMVIVKLDKGGMAEMFEKTIEVE
jgi:hypothetical protein